MVICGPFTMDDAAVLRRIFEAEDTLRKRLTLLETMRKVVGRRYWKSQGFTVYPGFNNELRSAVNASVRQAESSSEDDVLSVVQAEGSRTAGE